MEKKEANDICSFLSPPTFIANPVSTTEGTLIRTTAKEVGSSSAPRSSSFPSLPRASEGNNRQACAGALDRT